MDGCPPDWAQRIWKQNSVNGRTDRAATIVVVIIKDKSLTAFETVLEDARVDPDPKDEEESTPLVMKQEHVKISLRTVTTVVKKI